MATVFVVNKGAHDYSAATQYGELAYCSRGLISKYNINYMVRLFQDAFVNSSPEDYVLVTSLTTLCSIACAVFSTKHKRLNLLIFKDGKYVERRVIFDE